jgi:hypothetical protein
MEIAPVKKKIIISGAVVLALLVFGFVWLQTPFRVIRKLDARYRSVTRGMTSNEVQTLMNYPAHWHTNANAAVWAGWDDTPVSQADAPQVASAVRYTVSTFFLPVSFEFTFDSTGRVVGKHRHD